MGTSHSTPDSTLHVTLDVNVWCSTLCGTTKTAGNGSGPLSSAAALRNLSPATRYVANPVLDMVRGLVADIYDGHVVFHTDQPSLATLAHKLGTEFDWAAEDIRSTIAMIQALASYAGTQTTTEDVNALEAEVTGKFSAALLTKPKRGTEEWLTREDRRVLTATVHVWQAHTFQGDVVVNVSSDGAFRLAGLELARTYPGLCTMTPAVFGDHALRQQAITGFDQLVWRAS